MSIQAMSSIVDRLEMSGVGYDQGDRWSWLDRQNRTIVPNKETDCSAGCGGVAWLAGYPVDINDPLYTGNFRQKMVAAGFEAIAVAGKGLSSLISLIREGDFILGPGHVVYVREPNRWWSAENDENGKSNNGKAGDQTGVEARFRSPYARSRGWQWVLRPTSSAANQDTPAKVVETGNPFIPLVVDGERGPKTISALQYILSDVYNALGANGEPLVVDGEIGKNTIRALQRVLNQEARAGLTEDGISGPKTVRALQARIGTTVDGVWGKNTTRALQERLNTNTL